MEAPSTLALTAFQSFAYLEVNKRDIMMFQRLEDYTLSPGGPNATRSQRVARYGCWYCSLWGWRYAAKNNPFIVHTGHVDNEIDSAGSEGLDGMIVDSIKPQGDRFVFPDIHRVIVLDSGRLLNWGAPLASFLLGAGAA